MGSTAGRPRKFDTEAALDAALELFWKNGYRITTTRELEASLGLNQSSIYNAFGSKEALLAAALERYERRITGELLGPLEGSSEGLASIEAFVRALGHWITHDGKRGCMLVNLMAEDAGASEAISKRGRAYRRRLRRALSSALERAARANEIAPDAVETRAELLLCQVLGLNIAARGGARPAELQRLAAAVSEQVCDWRRRSKEGGTHGDTDRTVETG